MEQGEKIGNAGAWTVLQFEIARHLSEVLKEGREGRSMDKGLSNA